MSTHGDILVCDKGNESESAQWLHAYSDGHADEVYEGLVDLPDWVVRRARLDLEIPGEELGEGWWIEQYNEEHWKSFLSVCAEVWASNMASLICSRWFNRWCPIPEEIAPWHEIGEPPDFVIICEGRGYKIIASENMEDDLPIETEVSYLDRLGIGIAESAKKLKRKSAPKPPKETNHPRKR